MKWILLLTLPALGACAQNKSDRAASWKPDILNAKFVKLAPDTNHLVMIENVVIRYGDLSALADSAYLDKPEQTITLYGTKDVIFNGKAFTLKSSRIVRYKKGEDRFETD